MATTRSVPNLDGCQGLPADTLGAVTNETLDDLDWTKLTAVASCSEQVLPVAVQNVVNNEVVMVAYVSREAVDESIRTGQAVFYSTSKDRLHHKGETSGDALALQEVRVNCDSNSLLFRVRLEGSGACHEQGLDGVAYSTCFHNALADE